MCQWRCPGCPSPRRLATDRTHWRRPLSEECTSPPWAVLAGPLRCFPTRTPKITGPGGRVGNANPAGRSEAPFRAQLKGFLSGRRTADGGRRMAARAAAAAPAFRAGRKPLGPTLTEPTPTIGQVRPRPSRASPSFSPPLIRGPKAGSRGCYALGQGVVAADVLPGVPEVRTLPSPFRPRSDSGEGFPPPSSRIG